MSLSVGIVGLPNAGKSTLFNALASRRLAETAPRPFTTIDPHEAVVAVPDENVSKLYEILVKQFPDIEKIPATVMFTDIAGLIKGAHKGEGLGNQFLGKIREVDATVHVVSAFYDPSVAREDLTFEQGSLAQIVDDIEIVQIELELGGIDKKPSIIVLNVGEDDIDSINTRDLIVSITEKFKAITIAISAKIEEDLIDFTEEERTDYLIQAKAKETGLAKLIKSAYSLLGLISFYTIKGGTEITAWSLKNGKTAIEAAAVVHNDFAKKFIKAEVVNVEDLLSLGGWKEAGEAGKVRLEGRDYIVNDNDVIEFKVGS